MLEWVLLALGYLAHGFPFVSFFCDRPRPPI